MSIFRTPTLFDLVDAPREALLSLHAGETVLLGRLDDEDLDSVGMERGAIDRSIRAFPHFTEQEQQKILDLLEAVRSRSIEWIPLFGELVHDDEGWRDFVSLHWCLRNPWFDEINLSSGPMATLLDTMLEITRLEASVVDVQGSYAALAQEIADGKLSGTEEGLFLAGNVLAGAAVGWFTFGAGAGLLGKASEWVNGQARQADAWILELAMQCMTALTVSETRPEIHRAIVQDIRAKARPDASGGSTRFSERQLRMLRSAYAGLNAEGPAPEGSTDPLPDFSDWTVRAAKQYCEVEGHGEPLLMDAVQFDGPRGIWDDSKWVVRAQRPSAGSTIEPGSRPVVLAYSRPFEGLRLPLLRRHLDDAEAGLGG
ncbi:hypothetical protein QE370_002902 [Aeromicrobium sp. SORGH_AS981]|uniref:PASTA domain-containing protein n=1 Tax=Aeromicrobium sp. SORGH_AS_0981 TaxID=3041802 RepID=UPI0028609767|nr:hypothetical protein [Aeromicrobium sp. SORGH_AS_0981]MDR6119718.1 hypothetical protein [Aeromicrobium sp. SORGH_AS_0981]